MSRLGRILANACCFLLLGGGVLSAWRCCVNVEPGGLACSLVLILLVWGELLTLNARR